MVTNVNNSEDELRKVEVKFTTPGFHRSRTWLWWEIGALMF